jgi:mannose-6-phosphate isomerase
VELLRNPVRAYAWGSRTAIAALLGRPVPAPHPEAELWIGAHPTNSSMLLGEPPQSLLAAIERDPAGQLGRSCADRFGPRLPFLLKVLAADEPLSMQAHPSAKLARDGFAREQSSGVPLDAPQRNYKDSEHKPELVCALTEFHVLAGFRAVPATLELLHALDVRELAAYVELLAAQPDGDGLRALFTTWITLPPQAIAELMPCLLAACVAHIRARGPFSRECRTVLQLAEPYPTDPGVMTSLLLNHVQLAPGEAIYLPPGNLHAHLHGTAVEIQANSDNVLRGGLTPKHVDVPELLRVLDFAAGDLRVQRGEPAGAGACGREVVYRTPMPDFELSRLDWSAGDTEPAVPDGGPAPAPRPQVLLCTAGHAVLEAADGRTLQLPRGAAAWVPASDPPVVVRGAGEQCRVFRATTGSVPPTLGRPLAGEMMGQ